MISFSLSRYIRTCMYVYIYMCVNIFYLFLYLFLGHSLSTSICVVLFCLSDNHVA